VKVFQHLLHIPNIIQQIGEDYHIYETGRLERERMCIRLYSLNMGSFWVTAPQHFRREVDTQTGFWRELRKQRAITATDFENTLVWGDHLLVDLPESFAVVSPPIPSPGRDLSNQIPVAHPLFLVAVEGCIHA
jgi:hypothetical protein